LWPQTSHIEAASLGRFRADHSGEIRKRVPAGHPGPSRNDRARVASRALQSYVCRDGIRRAVREPRSKAPSVRREGVQVRHARRCEVRGWAACSCSPSYQAQVWSPRDRRPIRKSFATIAEAVAWRQEAQVSLRRGTMRAPTDFNGSTSPFGSFLRSQVLVARDDGRGG
jgi:hypothetical protein